MHVYNICVCVCIYLFVCVCACVFDSQKNSSSIIYILGLICKNNHAIYLIVQLLNR